MARVRVRRGVVVEGVGAQVELGEAGQGEQRLRQYDAQLLVRVRVRVRDRVRVRVRVMVRVS